MVRKVCSSTGLVQSDSPLSSGRHKTAKWCFRAARVFQRSATEPEENIMAKKEKKKTAKKAGKKKTAKKTRR